jgi:hypothetical protein
LRSNLKQVLAVLSVTIIQFWTSYLLALLIVKILLQSFVFLHLGNEWKFSHVNNIMEELLGDALSNDVICVWVHSCCGTLCLCQVYHVPQSNSHDTRHRHIECITLSVLGPDMAPLNPHYFNQLDAFVK